jgi:4-hydroxybenzoate polyprenyltransferase
VGAVSLVRLLRPLQWTKNLLVFAPLVFAEKYGDPGAWLHATIAFIGFSFASSAGYVLNDWMDRERDGSHPLKRLRPIASGAVSPASALAVAAFLVLTSLILVVPLNPFLVAVVAAYILASVLYSLILKNLAIVELLLVSFNYVLRVVAGAVALPVVISPWLLVGTLLLALVIVLGKRRAEMAHPDFRPVLRHYTETLLDQWLAIASAAAIVSYAIYSFQAHPGIPLFYTLPLVIFGIFRYLYLVYSRGLGAVPDRELVTDGQLLAAVLLWVALTVVLFQSFAVK